MNRTLTEKPYHIGGTCGELGHVYPKDSCKCLNCGYVISEELFDRMMIRGY